MRIALITLALTALMFIGSIVYSLVGKEWGFSLPAKTTSKQTVEEQIEVRSFEYQVKSEAKIEELTKKIDALAASQWVSIDTPTQNPKIATDTGTVAIPLSGKFLAQVMPTLEFSLINNNGIYDLHTFDNSFKYSTYLDAKQGIKALAINPKYDIFLKNMKAVSPDVYTVNETKTFPFRSFYINPVKQDTLVRLVIEIEWQVIALEIPKTRFDTFKKLLLKK